MSDRKGGNLRRERFRIWLISLPRSTKMIIALHADLVGLSFCTFASLWLALGQLEFWPKPILACLVATLVGVALIWAQGLYRSVVRYLGSAMYLAAARSAGGSALVGAALFFGTGMPIAETTRWALTFWFAAFLYICTSRQVAQWSLIRPRANVERERVIIYGAGQAGAQLAVSLLGADEYLPVAMIDDDSSLHRTMVNGLVVHAPSDTAQLISDTGATRVLLALPSASRRRRRAVLDFLADFPVHIQTLPAMADLISGQAKVDELKEVAVEDLLGRDPVPPNPQLLGATISTKCVMVTGAGGSIGSELCRQIVLQRPKKLILFDLSEFALYAIDQEVRNIANEHAIECQIIPLLGSVHHRNRVQEVLETFTVDTVFHAAAYKHVPMVEHNVLEGVHNNVIGTWNLAKAAAAANVKSFVLISTDKAVSPTNVMGATKRFAELILQALQDEHSKTRFCMVRFGNVLESSGSVVPLFRRQIRKGGPVTVTHREIIRYFMTIPEAAQLVIQAASMARGGDVFVLDMGEPVKIIELAQRMIRLMGLTVKTEENPDGDIAIHLTGLRPAEKLYEELLIGSDVSGTEHPRIMRARESKLSLSVVQDLLVQLKKASEDLDRVETREILMQAVTEYSPKNGVEDLVTMNQKVVGEENLDANILGFPGPNSE